MSKIKTHGFKPSNYYTGDNTQLCDECLQPESRHRVTDLQVSDVPSQDKGHSEAQRTSKKSLQVVDNPSGHIREAISVLLYNIDERAVGMVNRPIELTYRDDAIDQVLALYTTQLKAILKELPEKRILEGRRNPTHGRGRQYTKDQGFNQALDQCRAVIEKRMEGL